MANTRASMGESATLNGLICGTLTSFEEDGADIISALNYGGSSLQTITLKNVIRISEMDRMDNLSTVDISSGDYQLTFESSSVDSNLKLTTFFLRNNTVAKISISAFDDTPIGACNAPVYVPANLVDAYKADTYWKHFIIASINDYPVSDSVYVQITDTWDQIIAAENDGTYKTKYKIGDMKYININGEQLRAQIIAFDADDLDDGSGKAKITWLTKEQLPSHTFYTNMNDYDWGHCELRNWFRSTIYNSLDDDLKGAIKDVTKTFYSNGNEYSTTDNLWIPSYRELHGSNSYEKNGPQYEFYTSVGGNISKYRPNSASYNTWLLRTCVSLNNNSASYYYGSGGYSSGISTGSTYYEPVGFCT